MREGMPLGKSPVPGVSWWDENSGKETVESISVSYEKIRTCLCGWRGENVKLTPCFRAQASGSMTYKQWKSRSVGFCLSIMASESAFVAFPLYLLLGLITLLAQVHSPCHRFSLSKNGVSALEDSWVFSSSPSPCCCSCGPFHQILCHVSSLDWHPHPIISQEPAGNMGVSSELSTTINLYSF